MSSQKQIQELFCLQSRENVYDDFGCALKQKILHHGRLYLTENYICFYSNLVGMQVKLIIPLADVTKIAKTKTLGLISNAIKVHQGSKTYVFTSFAMRDRVYQFIHKLWEKVSDHAEVQSESETDDETDALN